MGGRSDLDDVTPGCWLSARKMDLEDAEIRRQVTASISSARDSRATGLEQ
jgi:hypothetical protein